MVALPKIVILSPIWLPLWGGGEQYHYRVAEWLSQQGFGVEVLCAIAAKPDFDNGNLPVKRFVPRGDFVSTLSEPDPNKRYADQLAMRAQHIAYIDEAVRFCEAHKPHIVLMGAPLQWNHFPHFRELYSRLKDRGIKVGMFYHDVPPNIEASLQAAYRRNKFNWAAAGRFVVDELRKVARDKPLAEWTSLANSPLFFEPDFVIANSNWSAAFLDPLGTTPTTILHPPLDGVHWSSPPPDDGALKPVDVMMVNPQVRKGNAVMRNVIEDLMPLRRFRVLKGGWGDSFEIFTPMIKGLPAYRDGRIDMVRYVRDIRHAYRSAGVLLFPSPVEGYGMTPVEAMSGGTPVVASTYPAVLEAVGEGALTLCPLSTTRRDWVEAIEEVLGNRPKWQKRALERSRYLAAREDTEKQALKKFLLGW